ncbi:Acetyltransferase (GNAT) domain-containing protein [Hymenobacter gelipurpurascens]|uniref:Acetyltransferase (GNAT) domain-containing protein n=1 Tax=Hymenobacter gelipurpurascens TaxID=89968 RepID=A0A212UC16_9BACT|nr:GNAT family N-acetyltransferase [Hymenobacter gelipurpurascens]SNC75789.1 Acetyltransferase (GNAT) domain-containing protein [Hymenobacter gelipurpurascens]
MFTISTDPARLDVSVIHRYLSQESYWAQGIPLETVQRAIVNSLNFGVYAPVGRQVAYARVVTDKATFAWLCDVFVLPEFQGQGIGKQLQSEIWQHRELQGLRRYLLATLDAHGLYRQFGFQDLAAPERYLEIKRANPYGTPTAN